MQKIPPTPGEITAAEIIAAITSSTYDVFSTMLGLEIEASEAPRQAFPATPAGSGLIALIGLAGSWAGTGSISCTGAFACRMAGRLWMCVCEELNEDVLDAAGEIANMIIGNVKTRLEENVGPMGLSTPTVIYGHDFQTRGARIHQWTVVPFACGDEHLYVQMCLAPNRDAGPGTLRPGLQVPQVLTV
jgi:CheY-specific phosphatase CheX